MEQGREVRDLEQAEAWVEAVVAGTGEEVAGAKVAVAEAWEEVLRQDRVDIVCVPSADTRSPTSRARPATR